jgi:hypothetical protein
MAIFISVASIDRLMTWLTATTITARLDRVIPLPRPRQ